MLKALSVLRVSSEEEQGQSPDEIGAGHPHLTLADVYAALAYYHDNRDNIDRQLRESERFITALQAQAMTRQQRITDRW